MREGAEFFRQMFNFNSPRIAVENPVQHKYAIGIHGKGKATQYIQPWQFGHTEQKRTGLWLRNLPALVPTDVVYDLAMQLPKRERERGYTILDRLRIVGNSALRRTRESRKLWQSSGAV